MKSKSLFPINSEGRLDIKIEGITQEGDLYHTLLRMSWKQFFLFFVLTYLLINSIFAFLYYIGGDVIVNARAGSYWDAFLFSFQTSSTIGYGHFIPKTNYAHFIMILDTISGLLFVALATGIAFGKFSRPTARVLFSNNIILSALNGKKTLMFRIGNGRGNQIVDANVNVVLTRPEVTDEGLAMRRIYDLKLVRRTSPLFGLSWTVMHVIDEESPLYKMSEEEVQSAEILFITSITGVDDVFSQMIYDRHVYSGSEVSMDKQFVDVMRVDSAGKTYIDYGRFHDLV